MSAPIPAGVGLLKTARAAAAIGCSRRTLIRWAAEDPAVARCVARQTPRTTWWSVQRLRDAGLLIKPQATPAPAIAFSYDLQPLPVAQ